MESEIKNRMNFQCKKATCEATQTNGRISLKLYNDDASFTDPINRCFPQKKSSTARLAEKRHSVNLKHTITVTTVFLITSTNMVCRFGEQINQLALQMGFVIKQTNDIHPMSSSWSFREYRSLEFYQSYFGNHKPFVVVDHWCKSWCAFKATVVGCEKACHYWQRCRRL